MQMMKRVSVGIAILVFCIQTTLVWAGKLDDFEKDATKDRPPQEKPKDSPDEGMGIMGELVEEIFIKGLYYGGQASLWRAQCSHTEEGIICRQKGEPLLPMIRVDLCYQRLQSNLSAIDGMVELGYGPLAISYRGTHFRETDLPDEVTNSSDAMNLHEVLALYRVSGTPYFEIDWGLGMVRLEGNDTHSGVAFSMPVKIQPESWLGFNIVPTVNSMDGNALYDIDGSILLTKGFISLRAGYRWLYTEYETLKGPYSGLSLHF